MGNHEWCFYGWREGAAHRFFGPANVPDVWSVKKVNPASMVHLTEKPVELARLDAAHTEQRRPPARRWRVGMQQALKQRDEGVMHAPAERQADAAGRQIHGHWRAEATHADNQNARGEQPLLAFKANLRQQDLAPVAG